MKKILIVDDKISIGKILNMYLSKEFEIYYFENPVRAIGWMENGITPDLIISDVRMPIMSGHDFLFYLKGNSLWQDIPVVMLSSEESTIERINLLQMGAADYILKPFNPMELKVRINRLLV